MEHIEFGETREVGTVRFHRYREGLKVTDLTNAGKRGKTVSELYVDVKYGPAAGDYSARLYDLCDLVCSTGNYSTVAALVDCYVDEHSNSLRIDERTYKGIEVQPAGFEVICIRNEHMSLSAGYDDFGVNDLTDRNNEPRLIPTCHSGKKTAIKRWYAYVKANRKQLETATFSQVWDAMRQAEVKMHFYCAMD
jgi:hypothetical protein